MSSRKKDSNHKCSIQESLPDSMSASTRKPRLRFKRGGTLRPEDDVYVERPADAELLATLLRGDFAYVLAPRQIGKSSLREHTARELRKHGVLCATIDLGSIGTEVTLEQWYFGLISTISSDLRLPDQAAAWKANHHQSAVYRFSHFLHRDVLGKIPQRIVVFVDEIDVVRRLPFEETDFFAAVRAIYNARASDPIFDRLTFCLLGVATPQELTRDPQRTPFNVGHGIRLEDFTLDEAAKAFVPALAPRVTGPEHWLEAVFHWTDGHPYMTHRLCEAIASQAPNGAPATVVAALVDKFFLQRGRFEDVCLSHSEDRFINNDDTEELLGSMLRMYRQILDEQAIVIAGSNPLQLQLRLCGMIADRQLGSQQVLRVRNRVFASIFNHAWLREYETRRIFSDSFEGWLSDNRNPDFLLKGQALDAAVVWARGRQDVDAEEHEFIEAGLDAARREQESRLLAQQAFHEQELRRRAEKQTRRVTFLAIVLFAALVAAVLLYREAARQRDRALNHHLTAITASASETRDPLRAAQLLREVARRLPPEQNENPPYELLRMARIIANERVPRREFPGPPFRVSALRFRQGVSMLNAMYENGMLLRWPLVGPATRTVLSTELTPRRVVMGLFSEDGRWAAMHVMDGGTTSPSGQSAFRDELQLHDTDGQVAPMRIPLEGCNALQLAFRRDGLLVLACGDGTLQGWRPNGGHVFTRLVVEEQFTDIIMSPSGEHIVVLWRNAERTGGTLYSLDANGQLMRLRKLGKPDDHELLAAGFDEFGGLVAVSRGDGKIWLYSTQPYGTPESCKTAPLPPSLRLRRLVPSPDGAYVSWFTGEGTNGTVSCNHRWPSRELQFNPMTYWQERGGMVIASEKNSAEHVLSIARVSDLPEPIDLAYLLHPARVSKIAAHILNSQIVSLATGSYDGAIRLWDFSDSFSTVIENAYLLKFNDNYSHLAIVRTNRLGMVNHQYIETWDLLTFPPKQGKIDCLKTGTKINQIWLDRTGKHLAYLTKEGNREIITTDECSHETQEINFSINEVLVRSDGNQLVILTQEKQIVIYDLERKTHFVWSDLPLVGPKNMLWLAGEQSILIIGSEESPYVFTLDNLPSSHRLLRENRAVDAVAERLDGEEVVVATDDLRLLRFSASDKFQQAQFLGNLNGRVNYLVVDDTGKNIAANAQDGRNLIYDISIKPLYSYTRNIGEKILSINSDGSYLSSKEQGQGIILHRHPREVDKPLIIDSAVFAVDNGRFLVERLPNGGKIKLVPWYWKDLGQNLEHITDADLNYEARKQHSLDGSTENSWLSILVDR